MFCRYVTHKILIQEKKRVILKEIFRMGHRFKFYNVAKLTCLNFTMSNDRLAQAVQKERKKPVPYIVNTF